MLPSGPTAPCQSAAACGCGKSRTGKRDLKIWPEHGRVPVEHGASHDRDHARGDGHKHPGVGDCARGFRRAAIDRLAPISMVPPAETSSMRASVSTFT